MGCLWKRKFPLESKQLFELLREKRHQTIRCQRQCHYVSVSVWCFHILDDISESRLYSNHMQWPEFATGSQCGLRCVCLGQAECVDASVCGQEGLSQALFILYRSVCFWKMCVCALRGSLCCDFLSGTQKPQYPNTVAVLPCPNHVGVMCRR